MTPEERWIRIENALEALAESQAQTDAQMRNLMEKHDAHMEKLDAHIARLDALLEKHDTGLRGLIVVSRTLVDSQNAAFAAIDRLSVTIDKFLQRGPNGNF